MSKTYTLKPGLYAIGDPAMLIKKNEKGDLFIKTLWDIFYKKPNEFQEIIIDEITFYITRTLGGDGIFSGIGTDTGTIMIIRTDSLQGDERFKFNYHQTYVKYIQIKDYEWVTVENFHIHFKNGFSILTA